MPGIEQAPADEAVADVQLTPEELAHARKRVLAKFEEKRIERLMFREWADCVLYGCAKPGGEKRGSPLWDRTEDCPLFVLVNNQHYLYERAAGTYRARPRAEFVRDVQFELQQHAEQTSRKCDVGQVADALEAMYRPRELNGEHLRLPCWLEPQTAAEQNDLWLPLPNGVINVTAIRRGEALQLMPRSPRFFTLATLPIRYEPAAECPHWRAFLEASLGDDPDKIALLQEALGASLPGAPYFRRFFVLDGVTTSGKGTIKEVATAVYGQHNTTEVELGSWSDTFALETAPGKLVIWADEAKAGQELPVQALKKLCGDSAIGTKRKHKTQTDQAPTAVPFLIWNDDCRPVISQPTESLWVRMVVIPFNRSFADAPDYALKERLMAELPGILRWMIDGLARVEERRRIGGIPLWTIGAQSQAALAAFRASASPLEEWLSARWEQTADPARTTIKALCSSYSGDTGHATTTASMGRALRRWWKGPYPENCQLGSERAVRGLMPRLTGASAGA